MFFFGNFGAIDYFKALITIVAFTLTYGWVKHSLFND